MVKRDDLAPEPVDADLKADPAERLAVPEGRQTRGPFGLILAACFVAHASILAFLLFEDFSIAREPTLGGRDSGGDRRRDAARAEDRTNCEALFLRRLIS